MDSENKEIIQENYIQRKIDESVESVSERIRKCVEKKLAKTKINFLNDSEIEYGENLVFYLSKLRCESPLFKFPLLEGTLVMTTYKIKFIPC